MTKNEKKLMENPEHKPLMDLPHDVRCLMRKNISQLLLLRGNGDWNSCESAGWLGEGYIYKINPNVQTDPVEEVYNVFVGADKVYKFTIPFPCSSSPKTSTRYLTTAVGMKGFWGIRYEGSDEWRTTLDTITWGIPSAVRFGKR